MEAPAARRLIEAAKRPLALVSTWASNEELAAFKRALGARVLATGHYARVEVDEAANRYRLLRGCDPQKDQSYFLWELTQDQLSRSLFPLGEMAKTEVRAAARRASSSAPVP